jgi:hypothetical protein
MRARPLYLLALLVAFAGLGAFVLVPPAIGRADVAALARARRIAGAMRDPDGAAVEPTGDCNGVGAYRCLHVDRDAMAVAGEVTASLRNAAGREPARDCNEHQGGRDHDIRLVDCLVTVRMARGHGVTAFVRTVVRQGPDRKPLVDGTQVAVYAD